MRSLLAFFIRRHFLVHVLTAVVVVVGISTALSSQREGFPAITVNQLTVTATLPGASTADVETKVTLPLEEAIAEVDGVEEYYSVVTDNVSVTTIEVYDDWSPQQVREVQSDVRQALDAIRDFPTDMEDDPVVSRVEPAKMPVLEIALGGPTADVEKAAKALERRLERVDGVSRVTLVGVEDPEVRILLDPTAARTFGIDLRDVVAAIERRNVSATGGILESDRDRKQVVMDARFTSPKDVARTAIKTNPDGGVVEIGDVARVYSTTVDSGLRVHTNGKPGVSVVVRKQLEADIISTVDAVKVAADEVELPASVDKTYVNDMSFMTRNRLALMASNGAVGLTLVILILALFLNRKAALWVSVGVPVVLLGVLVLLPVVGLTLNLISLAAFVVVLGLLVDDAVVVAERIVFKQSQPGVAEPEVEGVMSVAKPVLASAVTTSIAFTPMLALGGMPGKVAWALPVVVILALGLSLIESFFILPSHMVRHGKKSRERKPESKRRFVVWMERAYKVLLTRALRLRYLVVAGFIGLLGFAFAVVAPRMGFELFPQDDSEALFIKVTTPLGTPIEHTEAVATSIERQLPPLMGEDLLGATARIGHQDGNAVDKETGSSSNEAVVSAMLVPINKNHSAAQWARILEERMTIPEGATVLFEAKRLGPPLGKPVTVHVASNDDADRRYTAERVRRWLEGIDGVVDVEIDERPGIRQIELHPDPDKLAMRGLDIEDVAITLKAAFYGMTVSEHRSLDETTEFRVMFEPTARVDLDGLLDTPVRGKSGQLVYLRDVVNPVEVAAVSRMYHRDGNRTATVTAGVAPGSGLDASSMARKIESELLPSVRSADREVYIGGEATETAKTSKSMGRAAGLAIFGIVVVIAIILGSFLDAFLIITVIPFGAAGVIGAFYLHDKPFSMFAVLGIIGLAGVIVNASIVMVDAVKQRLADAPDGESHRSSVIEAVVERLRPIMVTTLTTLGGVFPTAYGLGGYDAVLSPMSLALGWGLVFATTITLLLVPSLFCIGEDLRGLFRRKKVEQPRGPGTDPELAAVVIHDDDTPIPGPN